MKHAREPAGRHRAVRPRYGRISLLGSSVAITAVAVLGGFGLLPNGADDAAAAGGSVADVAADQAPDDAPDVRASSRPAAGVVRDGTTSRERTDRDEALPPGSGTGRRIVFSEGRQRVWLVSETGEVERTYPVSGSVYDNLDPGTYQVYSRSRYAVGIDDSGTMEYFVRFTQGDQGAAIGFHTIPVDDGVPVQTVAQLGTPLSHGCIRQRTADAIALWEFAPVGTTVVVTA